MKTPTRALLLILVVGTVACNSHHSVSSLVNVTQEPEGPNCEWGGIAVQTGVDHNHNQQLDANEVTHTEYACNSSNIVTCSGGVIHDGTVTIHDASDLAPLAGVTCIDGDLIIAGPSLTSLAELADLSTVTGAVVIAANDSLASLDDLSNLANIGLTYLLQGNAELVDVSALASIKRAQDVSIVGNSSLTDLSGLETLTDLTYGLIVSGNPSLQSLHGLEGLRTSTQNLYIRSNRNLTSIDALANLQSIAVLEISGNATLPSISLPALERVNVRLLLNSNPAVTSIEVPLLTTLSDGIVFDSNPSLLTISAPAMLVTGHFRVTNDTSLTSVAAPNLAYATANLELQNVPALTAADFHKLNAVGVSLLMWNTALPDLTAFSNLTSIGGAFWVRGCSNLTSFTGLNGLEGVSGDVIINSNPYLASFTGLDSFTFIDGNATITSNPSLATQTTQTFVNSITVKGSVTIN